MTGSATPVPEPAGHWAAARHRELLADVARHLDPDAGLRDIMLHADHAGLTAALGGHLDLQAGLAAILPPPAAAPRETPGRSGTVAAITAADPAARIALRRSPVTRAAILNDLTVRVLTIASKVLTRDFARARDLASDLASDLALALASDFVHASVLARARDLTIAHASALARASDLDLATDPGRTLTSARALARDFASDVASVLAVDQARALAVDLDSAFTADLAHTFAGDLDGALARDLDRAVDLGREMALMVGDALGLRQVEGLAAALLNGALDDFTHADLARADLTGRDLAGIRWSEQGTTWPPGTDTAELRARSQQIAPGIYEITRPGQGDKARHHTPA